MSIDINGALAKRGLISAALEANWQPVKLHGRDGWAYPVYNAQGKPFMRNGQPARRWKSANGDAPKYLWDGGKPDGVRYYLMPDTVSAIMNSGIVYLASGEPDVLALRAAGIKNTLCWFDGETSVPPTFAADMKQLGVVTVYYYPDRDKTGMQAAAKLLAVCKDTGLLLNVCELPGELGSKTDLNALWMACEFNAALFAGTITTLDEVSETDLYLYGASANTAPLGAGGAVSLDATALYREWIGHIVDALGPPTQGRGRIKRWRCPLPHHKDEHPSFRITTDQNATFPWPVCTCGIQNNAERTWDIVAEAVNVDSWAEFKARKRGEGYTVDDDMPPPTPKQSDTTPTPLTSDIFEDSNTAISDLSLLLSGDKLPDVEPLVMPFNRLHQFGGFGHILMPKKLVFILGVSGGGKTNLAEQMENTLRLEGLDSIWWGPEWSPMEMQMRAVQRAGGASMERINLHTLWQIDKQNGAPDHANRGIPLGRATLEKTQEILRRMDTWQGKAHYIKENDLPPLALVEAIKKKVHDERAAGRKISTLWLDYFQLWTNAGGDTDAMAPERAMLHIKQLVNSLNLFGFVIVQPRKGDSEDTRDGEVLHHASAQGLSDQKCNLMLTLTPIFEADSEKKKDEAKVGIVKNSMGRTGSINVPVNWPRLLWVDSQESTANLGG